MYCIKISFETGDSFSSHDEVDTLELKWEDLDVAKKNLKRIREHYEWYGKLHGLFVNPNEYKELKKKRPKFVPKEYDGCIELLTDKGKTVQISAFWVGYFETLYSAEIIEEPYSDSDMIYCPKR